MDCRVKPGNDGLGGFVPTALSSMAAYAKRREGGARNGSLTIIVLTPLTTIFGARSRKPGTRRYVVGFVGVFSAVMSGPATGRRKRVGALRVFLPCLALIALQHAPAEAQTLTSDLLRPVRDGFVSPQDLPTRKTGTNTAQSPPDDRSNSVDNRLRNPDAPAPSRIGNIPTYGLPAASGASTSGYDSLNRKRQKAKLYPGQPKPKVVGPGNRPPAGPAPDPRLPPPRAPLPPSATANRTPIPPAMAGTVPGPPYRKRLKVDDDPFGAVGDYYGSFLVKTAVEFMGGYNTNPGRTLVPRGSPLYVVAPELLVVSDWERHAIVADLRGSYSGYTETFPPVNGIVS